MYKSLAISPRMLSRDPLQRCTLNDCHGACCEFGVWVDLLEKEKIINHADLIQSCMDLPKLDPNQWFLNEVEDDSFTDSGQVIHTRLVKRNQPFRRKTCVFQRYDHKCALQVASEILGEHQWFLKPFYCVLHPMDLNDNDQITLDETSVLENEKRSCLRHSQIINTPLEIFEEELRYLLGDDVFLKALNTSKMMGDSDKNQNKD